MPRKINQEGLVVNAVNNNEKVWTEAETARGYAEMAEINLRIAEEFCLLEAEADEIISKSFEE